MLHNVATFHYGMYLKSLELSGFKSFAKKTRLEFTSPITAIVGPNGSGKSNIAEAFRFVLGEQRMTQMRGKKTEDLIWNGSEAVSRSRHARVILTFDNRDNLFDVDFDEVVIERVIHRDASTEYRLNGSTVRLKDIVDLLGSAHIGASGHHIISQGETDRILLVNPWERKTMIEDALGLKIYQNKKEESQRKLDRTQEHKKEVESLRREIAPHLKFLKTQVEKVKKTEEMREELRELYHTYLAAEKERISSEQNTLKEKKEPLEHELKEVTSKRAEAQQTLSALEEKDEKSEKLLELEQKLQDVRNQKSELTRQLGQLEGELRARESVTQARQDTVASEDVIRLKEGIEAELEKAQRSEDLSSIRSILASIRNTLTRFVESLGGESEEQRRSFEDVRHKKEDKEEALRQASVEEGKLFTTYDALRKEIESDRDSGREAERAVFQLSSKEQELRGQLDTLLRDEEVLERDSEELTEERREAIALVGHEAIVRKAEEAVFFADGEERTEMRKRIERLKIRLEDAGTGSGEDVIAEYKEVQERDLFLERELGDLDASIAKLESLISDLEDRLAALFTEGVTSINNKFEELFALMFGGGSASLKVVTEELDNDVGDSETKEGIEIQVNLPRKKIRGLHMLSGGERALTSIALLFAMSQVNPPPFLLLDETDAALDEANSRRYGDMIEKLARDSQLILITHNRETMSRAGVLYGVTMGRDSVSQLLSVGFEEAAKVAK